MKLGELLRSLDLERYETSVPERMKSIFGTCQN